MGAVCRGERYIGHRRALDLGPANSLAPLVASLRPGQLRAGSRFVDEHASAMEVEPPAGVVTTLRAAMAALRDRAAPVTGPMFIGYSDALNDPMTIALISANVFRTGR